MLNSVVSMTRSAVAKVRVQRHTRVILCKGRARRRFVAATELALLISSVSCWGSSPVFSVAQQRFFQ